MNSITQNLCKRWNSFLLSGFFLVLLGTIALSSAFITTLATVLFIGIILIASGLAHSVNSFWSADWKEFFAHLMVGILSIVVGWMIITNPTLGALSITLLAAVYFIAAGLFKIAGSLLLPISNWGWLFLSGLVTLILGVLIVAQWPGSALWVIGLFIAIDLLFSGWTSIMFALALRKTCKLKNQHPVAP
jgi:uncharacterized membrane protein HdeD (DUF308 family)